MRTSTVFLSLSTLLLTASAQTTSAPASQTTQSTNGNTMCAQDIVDACLERIQEQVDACKANDWMCLCDQYTNLNTCYDNCPDSEERPPVENQVQQYCAAAEPLKSSSRSAAATAGTSAAAATSASATPTGDADATGASASPTADTFEGSAAVLSGGLSGGALAVVLGLAGVL